MAERESIPNHTQDNETGYLESNGFSLAFDAQKKTEFLKLYKANGLRYWKTCEQLGVKGETVNKHLRIDPVFQHDMEKLEAEYVDNLEAMSRDIAMTPKGVIDRMCQLKALLPGKYGGHENRNHGPQVIINLDGKFLEDMRKREQIIEAQIFDAGTPKQES